MFLEIDTTNREKICLALYLRDSEKCFEFETADQSAELLMAIDGLLKKEKKSLKDIRTILVNRGPGSFTGVRVGVTVANTLAWSLSIPVYGYKVDEKRSIVDKISKIRETKFSKGILPHYPKILNTKS